MTIVNDSSICRDDQVPFTRVDIVSVCTVHRPSHFRLTSPLMQKLEHLKSKS